MNIINEAKLDLFLQQAVIRANYDPLKFQIHQHFEGGGDYVLFRHSSVYFFRSGQVSSVQETRDKYQYGDYLRFDGKRVSKIAPEYYLKALASSRATSDGEIFSDDNQVNGNSCNNNNND